VSALDTARLGALFRERARISDEWHRAEQAAQRLTLDHHEFVRYKPHVVQFSGHGTADGVLTMGPHDRSEPVTADRLIQMFRWTGENLRMVFFNICDSEQHARAAAQFVDAAIGMHGTMHDAPARAFAAHLYSGLAFGNSLKKASIRPAPRSVTADSLVPQLFFRHGADPHKVVLVRPEGGDAP